MRRTMLKSKIHRATVTGSDLNYVGSITIDPNLLAAADIREHEQVHVVDIDIQAGWAALEQVRRPAGRIGVVRHPPVVVA